tara:strand:- start:111 stop:677 length:567 start_codon:yes stop_codon:yes gene_type:complete
MKSNIRKLCLQYSYLSLEKKDISDACNSVEKEISEYMQKYFTKEAKSFYNLPASEETGKNETENETTDEEKKKPTKHKDIKKIYRKIAGKIHPDKTDIEEEKNLFAEAAEAYEKNDIGKLLEISGIIRMDMPDLSEECIDTLRDNILHLSGEIEDMKTTSAWVWYKAQSHEEKMNILEKMVNILRMKQ